MAKTLEEGFATFLGRLAPLSSEHDAAASHKNSVKSCLENNFKCYEFFETGSFGSGTGIRHHSDTDYFAVCPSGNLSTSSSSALRSVKEALQSTFWQTSGIEVRTPSVRIPFGNYASETIEITPCTFIGMIDTPVGNKPQYSIADYSGGWMRSSPKAHNSYVKREDDRLGGKLKPLIRLLKAWKFYNNVPISSFYLELRATKYAESESAIVYDIDLHHILKKLYDTNLASIQDPMGISGLVDACSSAAKKEESVSKTLTGFIRAEKAYEQRSGDIDKCFYWWNMFFADKFPAR
jgi:hypothetical protein